MYIKNLIDKCFAINIRIVTIKNVLFARWCQKYAVNTYRRAVSRKHFKYFNDNHEIMVHNVGVRIYFSKPRSSSNRTFSLI